MTIKKTFALFFLCSTVIYAANPAPDNRPAVRNARRAIIAAENQIEAKIRGGLNLDQLDTQEIALLTGDTHFALPGVPSDVADAAKDAVALGLGDGVHLDNTDGVLTAWRWSNNKIWLPAGFFDPRHRLSATEAFHRAHSWPTSEHGFAIATSENH